MAQPIAKEAWRVFRLTCIMMQDHPDTFLRTLDRSCDLFSHLSETNTLPAVLQYKGVLADLASTQGPVGSGRMISRVFSLLPSLKAVLEMDKGGVSNTNEAFLDKISTIAWAGFQVTEFLYLLTKLMPNKFASRIDAAKWGRVSCMCWVVMAACALGKMYLKKKESGANPNYIKLLTTVLDLVLGSNWSLESGFLSKGQVGAFGMTSALAGGYLQLRAAVRSMDFKKC